MCASKRITSWLFFICIVVYFLFFIIAYISSFNYENDIYGQYFFSFLYPVVALVFLLFFIQGRRPGVVHLFVFTCFLGICILILFSENYGPGNEYFFSLVSVLLLCSLLFLTSFQVVPYVFLFISVCFGFELGVGLFQIFNVESFSNLKYGVVGTFQNSGLYGIYLACNLPILYYVLNKWQPSATWKLMTSFLGSVLVVRIRRCILFLLMLCSLIVIILTQSRTSYLCVFVVFSVVLVCYLRERKWARSKVRSGGVIVMVLLLVLCSCALGFLFFNMKQLSIFGRLLKLDVSARHVKEHLFTGTGLGRFTWHYPNWQAEYFSSEVDYGSNFYFSADESYLLFNEFIQMFLELGLVGTVVFVIFCFFVLTYRSSEYRDIVNTSKLTCISILACGFTSYPFHVNSILFIFFFCSTIVIGLRFSGFITDYKSVRFRLGHFITCLVALGLIISGVKGMYGLYSYSKVERGKKWDLWYSMCSDENGRFLTWGIENDGKFLTSYGEWLIQNRELRKEGILALEKARRFINTRRVVEGIGYAYTLEGDFDRAIESFEWLCSFLPNKFVPQSELLNLYISVGDSANAVRVAKRVSMMPVKIPSPEVERIRVEAKRILDRYGNKNNNF